LVRYKNLNRSFFHLVTIHAFDRWTDRQTDSFLIARPHLHCMQHSKNFICNQCGERRAILNTGNINIG